MPNAIQGGKAFVEFIIGDKKVDSGLARIGQKLKKVGSLGLAASAPLVAGFAGAAVAFASAGSQLEDMKNRTGVSVEALSELKYAVEQTGGDVGTLEKGFAGLSRTLFQAKRGAAAPTAALAEIGLTAADLQNLQPEEQLGLIADGLTKITNASTRGAVAQQIFGRAGRQLLPILTSAKGGLEQFRQEARALGLTMTTENAAAADALGDSLDVAKAQFTALVVQIGAAIAGPLTNFLQWSQVIVANIISFVRENPNFVAALAAIAATVAAVSAALITMGTILTIITLHPIVAFLALVAGLIAGIATYFGFASSGAGNFKKQLDTFVPSGSAPSLASQGQAAQSQLRSVGAGPVGAAITPAAVQSPTAADRTAEVVKWTRKSSQTLDKIFQTLHFNPITAPGALIAGAF